MGIPVAELLCRIDSQELTEWMAYYRIEPFGHRMDHFMTASHMALAANLTTGKKAKKYIPDDFLPSRKVRQTWMDMKKMLQEAFGGAKAPDSK